MPPAVGFILWRHRITGETCIRRTPPRLRDRYVEALFHGRPLGDWEMTRIVLYGYPSALTIGQGADIIIIEEGPRAPPGRGIPGWVRALLEGDLCLA